MFNIDRCRAYRLLVSLPVCVCARVCLLICMCIIIFYINCLVRGACISRCFGKCDEYTQSLNACTSLRMRLTCSEFSNNEKSRNPVHTFQWSEPNAQVTTMSNAVWVARTALSNVFMRTEKCIPSKVLFLQIKPYTYTRNSRPEPNPIYLKSYSTFKMNNKSISYVYSCEIEDCVHAQPDCRTMQMPLTWSFSFAFFSLPLINNKMCRCRAMKSKLLNCEWLLLSILLP